jgi:hypothetical protein
LLWPPRWGAQISSVFAPNVDRSSITIDSLGIIAATFAAIRKLPALQLNKATPSNQKCLIIDKFWAIQVAVLAIETESEGVERAGKRTKEDRIQVEKRVGNQQLAIVIKHTPTAAVKRNKTGASVAAKPGDLHRYSLHLSK